MIRQQRRAELRRLEKEYKKILDNKQFQKIIHSEDFVNLCKEEIDLLRSRSHSNRQLQIQFNYGCLLLARIKEIEKEIAQLNDPLSK